MGSEQEQEQQQEQQERETTKIRHFRQAVSSKPFNIFQNFFARLVRPMGPTDLQSFESIR